MPLIKIHSRYKNKKIKKRLLEIAFQHTGVFESFGAFFAWFVVMAENGFLPKRLLGIRADWDDETNNELLDSYGQEWVKKIK